MNEEIATLMSKIYCRIAGKSQSHLERDRGSDSASELDIVLSVIILYYNRISRFWNWALLFHGRDTTPSKKLFQGPRPMEILHKQHLYMDIVLKKA